MSVRQIDAENDWTFGAGRQNYLSKSDEIKQNIKTRLQTWKGECFFALSQGVDYNSHLAKGNNALLEEDIRRVIIQTYGVAGLLETKIKIEDRKAVLTYTIVDIYSQTWQEQIDDLGAINA